ncbi:hypothetical protein MtrunA17_Chr1g0160821 [Medicago truncatula]|uniref:Transmembrane protein, putative n=1 Tax=Medicago truncatula TaxID=3880 RepID=G7I9Z7_MEDTR|nr:transmembrane protein, putative [Medicago truncatula]RHN78003.1 hypothetical protein MtrunA17_Chr1g0160821 [Medicago truncatula]
MRKGKKVILGFQLEPLVAIQFRPSFIRFQFDFAISFPFSILFAISTYVAILPSFSLNPITTELRLCFSSVNGYLCSFSFKVIVGHLFSLYIEGRCFIKSNSLTFLP